jgi:pyrroloquinoline quinone (PQQ) biosynthesis protein C
MNFNTSQFSFILERKTMKLKHKLSEHPFYQLWNKGEITQDQLSKYSYAYLELVEQIPALWSQSVNGLNAVSDESEKVVLEESSHIPMWNQFKSKLNCENYPSMKDVNEELFKMNPSELLGAIHSFEVQQPEVAKTKKEGLLNHYGFSEADTLYFDEHMNEAEHIEYGRKLANDFAVKSDFEKGFSRGSEIFYNALDRFLN